MFPDPSPFQRDFEHIRRLAEEDDGGANRFVVLRAPVTEDQRPWLVWVHPGDACESDHPRTRIRQAAEKLESAMGQEILARSATHRLCVLHRFSSDFAFEQNEGRVALEYEQAMDALHARPESVVLWGDNLEQAAQWLSGALPAGQPVFLTGAWSSPEFGCVSKVGMALEQAGFAVEISAHSPSDPGTARGQWRPASTRSSRRKPRR